MITSCCQRLSWIFTSKCSSINSQRNFPKGLIPTNSNTIGRTKGAPSGMVGSESDGSPWLLAQRTPSPAPPTLASLLRNMVCFAAPSDPKASQTPVSQRQPNAMEVSYPTALCKYSWSFPAGKQSVTSGCWGKGSFRGTREPVVGKEDAACPPPGLAGPGKQTRVGACVCFIRFPQINMFTTKTSVPTPNASGYVFSTTWSSTPIKGDVESRIVCLSSKLRHFTISEFVCCCVGIGTISYCRHALQFTYLKH